MAGTAALTLLSLFSSCPTLCDPIDSSPPGSPVPGIFQARTLEWVAISKLSQVQLSDPMDCSPPGSSIHGIFQARVLEWGAIVFSKHLLSTIQNECLNFTLSPVLPCTQPPVTQLTTLRFREVQYLLPVPELAGSSAVSWIQTTKTPYLSTTQASQSVHWWGFWRSRGLVSFVLEF